MNSGPDYDKFNANVVYNPHIRFFESRKRGCVSVDLSGRETKARYQVLSDVKDPAASISTSASFAVESGRSGVVRA